MYTARSSGLGKLRAYHHALSGEYGRSLRRHDYRRAQAIFDLRRRVHRAILLREEWGESSLERPHRPAA
jgi:hypothetical protein